MEKYKRCRSTLYLIKKENGFAKYHHKLKDTEIEYIKTMIYNNVPTNILSAYFLISQSAIYNIKKSNIVNPSFKSNHNLVTLILYVKLIS